MDQQQTAVLTLVQGWSRRADEAAHRVGLANTTRGLFTPEFHAEESLAFDKARNETNRWLALA